MKASIAPVARPSAARMPGRPRPPAGPALSGGPPAPARPPGAAGRLRSLILLSGSLRPTPFQSAIGRPVLNLPLGGERSLLEDWCAQAATIGAPGNDQPLPIRVLAGAHSSVPTLGTAAQRIMVRAERDVLELRGTGGALRDATRSYDADDYVLVAAAASRLVEPLSSIVAELTSAAADVALVAHDDGYPCTLMLVRCGCLALVSDVGFADLKEQVLPQVARGNRVVVCRRPGFGRYAAVGVRTLAEYVAAVRGWAADAADLADANQADGDAYAGLDVEDPPFAVVEPGASVHPSATVYGSVVLDGGRVERGAVVVRSVVCPGGVVPRDAVVSDRIVRPGASDADVPFVLTL